MTSSLTASWSESQRMPERKLTALSCSRRLWGSRPSSQGSLHQPPFVFSPPFPAVPFNESVMWWSHTRSSRVAWWSFESIRAHTRWSFLLYWASATGWWLLHLGQCSWLEEPQTWADWSLLDKREGHSWHPAGCHCHPIVYGAGLIYMLEEFV